MYFWPVLNSSLSGYYRHIHIRWSQCTLKWRPLGWGSRPSRLLHIQVGIWGGYGCDDSWTTLMFYWCDSLGALYYIHTICRAIPEGGAKWLRNASDMPMQPLHVDTNTDTVWFCIVPLCTPSFYCVLFLIYLLPFVCNSLIIKLQFINLCFLSEPLKSHWMGETSFL